MQQEENLEDILKDLLLKDQVALDKWIDAHQSDINKKDNDGKTLLILLAERSNQTKNEKTLLYKLLSNKNTDVNVIDSTGKSALRYSSIPDILDHASYKVNTLYPDGSTDFTWAAELHEIKIIEKLLEKPDLDVNVCMQDSLPVFSFLVRSERMFDVIHSIFQHPNFKKASLSICDLNEKRTILHYACLPKIKIPALTAPQPSTQVCPSCRKFTPRVQMRGEVNHFVQQQYQWRKDLYEQVILEVLEYENMVINKQDKDGYTAIMYAVESQGPRVIQAFLNHPTKCDLTLKNVYNQTVHDIVNDATSGIDTRIVTLIKYKWDELPQHKEENFIATTSLSKQVELLCRKVGSLEISKVQKQYLMQQLECFESDAKLYTTGKNPNQSGGMSAEDRQKLIARRVFLCENLSPIEVLDHLIQDDIITEDSAEAIKINGTRREITVKLLSVLPNAGPNAFECFMKALFDTSQGYIANELISGNPS